MSHFYYFYSTLEFNKQHKGTELSNFIDFKHSFVTKISELSNIFNNDINVKYPYLILLDSVNITRIRNNVMDTMLDVIEESLLQKNLINDYKLISEMKYVINNGINVIGYQNILKINNIFHAVYESYRIQIIIDCFSGKIKNVNVHNVSVLIEQMISIYIDFMKTLNGAIKRKSTLYIMTN